MRARASIRLACFAGTCQILVIIIFLAGITLNEIGWDLGFTPTHEKEMGESCSFVDGGPVCTRIVQQENGLYTETVCIRCMDMRTGYLPCWQR